MQLVFLYTDLCSLIHVYWKDTNANMECKHQYDLDSSKKGHFRVVSSFCFKARLSAKPLIRKLFFTLVQIKLIFTRKSRKVLHLASFWKWGFWNSEMVCWGWRDAWYDQTTFTVFEILSRVFNLHSSRLRTRSFGSSRNPPQGQVGQEHVTHPYERLYRRLPAIRRSFFLFGEKRLAKEEKRNAWYEYDTFTFQVICRPWVLKINQT